jgi:hypothetical protein
LIVSALAFTIQQVTETHHRLFWRDSLKILELRTGQYPFFKVILANDGDGPVYASLITIFWQGGTYPLAVERIVPVNGIEIVEGKPPIEKPFLQSATTLADNVGVPSKWLLDNSALVQTDAAPRCFSVFIYDVNNATLEVVRRAYASTGQKLVVGSASAEVLFISSHSGARKSGNVPVAATFAGPHDQNCKDNSLK